MFSSYFGLALVFAQWILTLSWMKLMLHLEMYVTFPSTILVGEDDKSLLCDLELAWLPLGFSSMEFSDEPL